MASSGTARGLKQIPSINRHPADETQDVQRGEKKRRRKIKYSIFTRGAGVDMPLLFIILILLSIGLVMLFSASYANSYYRFNNSYYYIQRQAIFAVLGVVIMLVVSTFDYHHFHKFAYPIYGVVAALLVVALLMPSKSNVNRWIEIGPIQFQPSELAKFALIILFAHMISQRTDKMGTARYGFWPFMAAWGMYAVLIIAGKHVSATLIITMIAFIIMFIGGTKPRYFVILGILVVVALAVVLIFSDNFGYAMKRILAWIDPFNPPEGISSNDTYQTRQSLYAIGSGGLLGVGLGQSKQKYLYLPEPQNDFIFSIVCEELGFVGAIIIILLFAFLIYRSIYVSLHAKDKFGTLIGLGITFQVGLQIVLNICVVTNTIPNTGISLPFFSYGGTALIILLAEMGVLLQISRNANIERS